MAKLRIGNHVVTIDDSFKKLSPEQQQATVEEIAARLPQAAGTPDPEMQKYTGEVLSGDPQRSRAAQVQGEYDRMPVVKKILTAADDTARLAAEGVSMGGVDALGGKIHDVTGAGPSYEERAQNTQDARSRAGWAGTAAEVAGGVAGLGKVGGLLRAAPVAGKAIRAAEAGGMAGRLGVAAAENAAYGAGSAANHGEDIATGAALGGALGAGGSLIGSAIGRGASQALGKLNKDPVVPTSAETRALGEASYKAADDAGVVISKKAVNELKDQIQAKLTQHTYSPDQNPTARNVVNKLWGKLNDNMTLSGLEDIRRTAIESPSSAKDAFMARKVRDVIDNFAEHLDRSRTIMGDAQKGVKALQDARKSWATFRKAQMFEEAVTKAIDRAQTTGTGGNVDNTLRQEFRKILYGKKSSRGLTKDERKAIQLIINNGIGRETMRVIGKLGPSTGGLTTILQALGAFHTGGASLALPAVGALAKRGAENATHGLAADAIRIARAGGRLEDAFAGPNALQLLAKRESAPLGRAVGAGLIAGDQ